MMLIGKLTIGLASIALGILGFIIRQRAKKKGNYRYKGTNYGPEERRFRSFPAYYAIRIWRCLAVNFIRNNMADVVGCLLILLNL